MTIEYIKKANQVLANTYKRNPIVITKGEGAIVWDTDGKSYIDFVSGIAVCNLGHAHPRVANAIYNQAKTLCHVSNLYYTTPQIELASILVENSFADKVFFANSGAEANEAAIKLARKYFKDKGEKNKYKIITMEKSFHGRTMGTLSATGQEKIQKGFDPLLPGFDLVPFNNIPALKSKIDDMTCAVMLEPIQGEGGVCIPDSDYLKNVRKICDEKGLILIFDEIQTGLGRTGKLFAYEHFGTSPDIMTLAKALGNGVPIGAMLAKEEIAKSFVPGSHASTFGGMPLTVAAALETVKVLLEENLAMRSYEIGAYFKERLMWLKDRHDSISEVRGFGLLIGAILQKSGTAIVEECLKKGFLINCVQDNILRFIPPLIIKKEQIDLLINCLDEVIN
ncbi:MAG: acetylornithine transaminase [Desulfobacterales bacterium]|nr:acetylornithine transaminase [Desulfobacterales bacterium]